MRHWILGSVVLLALVVAPQQASGEPDRQALLERADMLEYEDRPAEILALLGPYAGEDDPEVLVRLANAALLVATNGGDGSPVTGASIQPAIDYARRTADLGVAMGWNLLWIIHSNGLGVEVDVEQAAGYLRAGAEGGDVGALLNLLGQLYTGTPFFEHDVDAACEVYDRLVALDVELPDSVPYVRASMLAEGQCGLEADPAAGFAQFQRLAEGGYVEAQRVVGLALFHGWFAAPDQAAALPWFEKAAAQGDGMAMWQLGTAHAMGHGVERDDARAVHWFQQGADVDYPPAIMSLGVMYASGAGVRQDFQRAKGLYEKAVMAGETHALRNLAVMHVLGQGTPPDPVQAQVYYLQHLHAGNEATPDVVALLEAHLDEAGRVEAKQRFRDWLALQEILAAQ